MILTIGNKIIMPKANTWANIEPVLPTEVQIGTQIWKTSNLAIDDGGSGIKTAVINLGKGDITEYYYTWDAAQRIASSIGDGWHLPSTAEFNTLANAIGSDPGTKLKSTYGWNNDGNGTDDYGFNGLPVGHQENNGLSEVGNRTYYWTTTQSPYSAGLMINRDLYYAWGSIPEGSSAKGSYWYSVRLVKDA